MGTTAARTTSWIPLTTLVVANGFATTQAWTGAPPQPCPRIPSAQVYDAYRGRTVLFGGSLGFFGLTDTWEHDGSHWMRVTTANQPLGVGPSARMAYDFLRLRTVLFGVDGITWEYDGVNWTARSPATSPPGRMSQGMAYDLGRGRTVLFGGVLGPTLLQDTWEFDGSMWQQRLTQTTPPAGARPLSYDIVRSYSMMLTEVGDTWLWDGVDWRVLHTVHRPTLTGHCQYFDLQRQRTVVYGGTNTTNGAPSDAWEFDGGDWTQVTTAGRPPLRGGATISCDLASRALLFGGNGQDQQLVGDTWELSARSWRQLDVAPPPRLLSAIVHDTRRDRVVLVGGLSTAPGCDTWERSASGWQRIATATMPPARDGIALVFDPVRGRTFMFGGSSGPWTSRTFLADAWEYDGVDWQAVQTGTPTPLARANHAMAYDRGRRRIVLFGGTNGSVLFADTWEFDGTRWQMLGAPSAPLARMSHALAYDARRELVVLYGGFDYRNHALYDTWEFDGQAWTERTNVGTAGYQVNAMTFDAVAGRVLLVGGGSNIGPPLPAVSWHYDGVAWTQLQPTASPLAGSPCGLVADAMRGRVVLYDSRTTGTWEFEPARIASWAQLGRGCGDHCGEPALDATTALGPVLGAPFTLRVTSQCAQPVGGTLALGFDLERWNGTVLPTDLAPLGLPNCRLWIAPIDGALSPLSFQGSVATLTVQVPAIPELAGLVVGAQAATVDAAGSGAVTNALVLRIF